MTAFLAMLRRQLSESKWLLGISALALFAMSWLSVYITRRIEVRMNEATGGSQGGMRMLRGMGGAAMDFSTAAIEVAWWNHPFIVLVVCLWAIARGSGSVAAEIERGTLDLTLSRPTTRASFLLMQVAQAVLGLGLLAFALIVGNLVGTQYNKVNDPPSVLALARPAWNLAVLGFAIFGYTLIVSAGDVVRWRATLFGSVLTLAAYITPAIVNSPGLEDYKWFEKFSVFKAFSPVEAIVKGEHLAFNTGILATVGLTGIIIAYLIFRGRDLPANS